MKLNFKTYGQGEPLIILHGVFGSLDNWVTLSKKIAENNQVFIIDQRNHGKSPHSIAFNYELLVEDLLEFMEEHNIKSAYLLGHSMGGKVVMNFASKYPSKVKKLIVADIAPIKYKEGHQFIFDALFDVDLSIANSRKEVEWQLEKHIQHFGIRQFLMKGLTRNKQKEYIWKFNLIAIWNAYKNIIGTSEEKLFFKGETLFIKGENSSYIQEKDFQKINQFFPNNKIEIIKNASHWLHAEKPKAFYEIVKAFLES